MTTVSTVIEGAREAIEHAEVVLLEDALKDDLRCTLDPESHASNGIICGVTATHVCVMSCHPARSDLGPGLWCTPASVYFNEVLTRDPTTYCGHCNRQLGECWRAVPI